MLKWPFGIQNTQMCPLAALCCMCLLIFRLRLSFKMSVDATGSYTECICLSAVLLERRVSIFDGIHSEVANTCRYYLNLFIKVSFMEHERQVATWQLYQLEPAPLRRWPYGKCECVTKLLYWLLSGAAVWVYVCRPPPLQQLNENSWWKGKRACIAENRSEIKSWCSSKTTPL